VFRVPHGRALRTERGAALTAAAIAREDWIDPVELVRLSPEERVREGQEWLGAALDEHASIVAFVQLAAELMVLGAPRPLVLGARRAAADEARHTRLCFSIASAYLGRRLGPTALPRLPVAPVPSLVRLAQEALLDGCFGEGVAARLAELRAPAARDPVVRRALEIIAEDEARHADLGWRTLEWCLECGGADVREALERTRSRIRSLRLEASNELAARAREQVAAMLEKRLWRYGLRVSPRRFESARAGALSA
jgi:hypothetical protein